MVTVRIQGESLAAKKKKKKHLDGSIKNISQCDRCLGKDEPGEWDKQFITTELSFRNFLAYEMLASSILALREPLFSYICFPHSALSFSGALFTFLWEKMHERSKLFFFQQDLTFLSLL